MNQRFPDSPDFQGLERPTRIEAEVFGLEVEGEIPAGLNGTFYRVQPDPQFPPRNADDIFFNGDGLVSAFHIAGGRVDFRQRYARTPKFELERRHRRALFGHYRNRFDADPACEGVPYTTSNTGVFVHGGRLLALKEDGLPTSMDPFTLETHGPWDFGGRMTGKTFSAHPKIDPVSGELLSYGYEARGDGSDDMVFYAIDREGRLTKEIWFKSPWPAMVHDWGVTQRHVIFPIMPLLVSSAERQRQKLPRFHYRRDLPVKVGVMRRDGDGSDLRWFDLPNGFPAHSLNAYDDGDGVVLDMTIASDNVFPFFPSLDGVPTDMMNLSVPVTRIAIDLERGRISATPLTDPEVIAGDFPHCDDRYMTRPYRYAFMTSIDYTQGYDVDRLGPPSPQFFNGIGKLDLHTRTAEKWWAGEEGAAQEPVFAPRSPDAPEGDGWVLCVVNRMLQQRADLVILDSMRLSDGPVATCRLPFRLRTGLHGNWVPACARRAVPKRSSRSTQC